MDPACRTAFPGEEPGGGAKVVLPRRPPGTGYLSMSSRPPSNSFSTFSFLLGLVFLTIMVLVARDSLTQDPAVVALAREVACAAVANSPAPSPLAGSSTPPERKPAQPPTPPCSLQMTRWESSVLRRSIELESGKTRAHVACTRRYLVLGDYECRPTP